MEQHSLLSNIGLAFVIATLFAFIAKVLKQPLILAYLLAGVVIGPQIGFAWVKDQQTIELITEIGLILGDLQMSSVSRRGTDAVNHRHQPISPLCGDGNWSGDSHGIYSA